MKLKIFQLCAIVNVISVVAFTGSAIYFSMSKSGSVNIDWSLFLVLMIAGISVLRDIIALYYVRICRDNLPYVSRYKIMYVILGVIMLLITGVISWAFYLAWKEQNPIRINRLNVVPFVTTIFYAISTMVLTFLDFYVYTAMEKRKDPAEGLLDEFAENHSRN